ncbi:hypothetical protein ACLMJK_001012 [Lecanora helva]
MPVAENFRRKGRFSEVAFIFPNAPNIPITVTNFTDLAQAHDQPGILKSREYFNGLIKAEIDKGIPSERIVLGILFIPKAIKAIANDDC